MIYEANSNDSALWQTLVGIHRVLSEMSFDSLGTDNIGSIQPQAIQIRKLVGSDQSGSSGTELMPGLLVTLPRAGESPMESGTNREIEIVLPILIQLIWKDHHANVLGVRTLTKWQEDIQRKLCNPNLNLVDSSTVGVSYQISHVTQVFGVDPKVWQLHSNYQCGVMCNAIVRMTWSD